MKKIFKEFLKWIFEWWSKIFNINLEFCICIKYIGKIFVFFVILIFCVFFGKGYLVIFDGFFLKYVYGEIFSLVIFLFYKNEIYEWNINF